MYIAQYVNVALMCSIVQKNVVIRH